MMNKDRNISLILLPVVIAVSIIAGVCIGSFLSRERLSPGEQKLRELLGLIDATYVDEVDVDSLLEAALPDVLA